MAFEGFTPITVERFGGLVTHWPAEKLPNGVSPDCRNVCFTPVSVMTREGLTRVLATGRHAPVTGLAECIQPDGTQFPLVFDAEGSLFVETPAGSGALRPISSQVALVAGTYMNAANAYKRIYLAFGDGRYGAGAPASYDGTNLDPIGLAPPAGSSAAVDASQNGDVASGLRHGIVMFQTRSGYITAPQAPFSWTAAGGHRLLVTNLPLGPSQVVARIVAFTVAGGSSAGPYFYIGATQTIDGVLETSTVVADNLATSATFNFDDTFLTSSTDSTAAFRQIPLAQEAGVLFSPSTRRLIWWGEAAQPSVLRLSEPDNPETYYGDTGFISIAEDNGERITACFEFQGQVYVGKERSLYLLAPNDRDPATWQVREISRKVGISGPRAIDVGPEFAAWAHRSGAYIFTGGDPTLVSLELDNLWKQINWTQAHLIWVHIDAETRQLRIGVPFAHSSSPNLIFKVDYQEGWDSPIIVSRYTGAANGSPGRKWCLDDIAAFSASRIERRPVHEPAALGYTPAGTDNRVSTTQLLLASANADGTVNAVDPIATTDNGAPIDARYQTAFLSSMQATAGTSLGVQLLGGISLSAVGEGDLSLTAIANHKDRPPATLRSLALTPQAGKDYKVGCRVQGERIALQFASALQPGGHFELRRLFAWLRTTWPTRT